MFVFALRALCGNLRFALHCCSGALGVAGCAYASKIEGYMWKPRMEVLWKPDRTMLFAQCLIQPWGREKRKLIVFGAQPARNVEGFVDKFLGLFYWGSLGMLESFMCVWHKYVSSFQTLRETCLRFSAVSTICNPARDLFLVGIM